MISFARQVAELAHALFVAEGWRYHDSGGPVASIGELEATIDELLDTLEHHPEVEEARTGRFVVRRRYPFEDSREHEIEVSLELGAIDLFGEVHVG